MNPDDTRQQDGFATRAIHVGQEPDVATGAVIVPIYQTSTYAQSEVGVHKGFDYSRTANPTRAALEACLASLDNGRYGLAFASGMAAEDTLLHLFESGDHVVACDDVYGGTFRLFHRVLERVGLRFTFVDATRTEDVAAAIEDRTRLIRVKRVYYPGLESHPQHTLAKRQMVGGFGGMLSFEIQGGVAAAREVARRTRLFTLAESLGGVESLIELPALMTHASLPAQRRQDIGIDDGLIRLSVGIEEVDDLIDDLAQALA
ncbi:MAG: PLP-dependent transferase [Chloroflexi bacterium]|nr:PLP-dependent transferase [Chloroflexota bacterium]